VSERWNAVTIAKPCPSCGKGDWCAWTPDGSTLRCMRAGDTPAGMKRGATDAEGGTLYRVEGEHNGHTPKRPTRKRATPPPQPKARLDLSATLAGLQAKLTPGTLDGVGRGDRRTRRRVGDTRPRLV